MSDFDFDDDEMSDEEIRDFLSEHSVFPPEVLAAFVLNAGVTPTGNLAADMRSLAEEMQVELGSLLAALTDPDGPLLHAIMDWDLE